MLLPRGDLVEVSLVVLRTALVTLSLRRVVGTGGTLGARLGAAVALLLGASERTVTLSVGILETIVS